MPAAWMFTLNVKGDLDHEKDVCIGFTCGGSGRDGAGADLGVLEGRILQGVLRRQVRADVLPGRLHGFLLPEQVSCVNTAARIAIIRSGPFSFGSRTKQPMVLRIARGIPPELRAGIQGWRQNYGLSRFAKLASFSFNCGS